MAVPRLDVLLGTSELLPQALDRHQVQQEQSEDRLTTGAVLLILRRDNACLIERCFDSVGHTEGILQRHVKLASFDHQFRDGCFLDQFIERGCQIFLGAADIGDLVSVRIGVQL